MRVENVKKKVQLKLRIDTALSLDHGETAVMPRRCIPAASEHQRASSASQDATRAGRSSASAERDRVAVLSAQRPRRIMQRCGTISSESGHEAGQMGHFGLLQFVGGHDDVSSFSDSFPPVTTERTWSP